MNERKIIILGTGNAMTTKCFNTCFVLQNNGENLLVDAGGGNGILVQLEKAGIQVSDIHQMFVTHGHTDHVLGVIWMIRKVATLMNQNSYEGTFHIYCHDVVNEIIRTICNLTLGKKFLKHIDTRIMIHEVVHGEQIKACGMELTCFDIFSTKAKQFGFQAVFADGTKLACLGDEPYNEGDQEFVKGCDWMLCEAFCLYEDRERFKPYEKHHSTALDAGKLASELGIGNLVLYHTEDKTIETRKSSYTKEAKEHFAGPVYVPDDLECIEIGK